MQLIPDSFLSIDRLYGDGTYHTLAKRSVYVVGIGGVGSWVVECLARTGIGHIHLADLDDVCVTNINRQVQALSNTVGQSKIEAMADRCRLISKSIDIQTHHSFITEKTVADAINCDLDLIIDCGDNQMAKATLIAYARRLKIPIITIGAAGGRIDPTRVQMCDLSQAKGDALLAAVRQTLRNRFGFSRKKNKRFAVSAIFSDEQTRYRQYDGLIGQAKPDSYVCQLNCKGALGAVTHVTGTFAFHAAARAINLLLSSKLPE